MKNNGRSSDAWTWRPFLLLAIVLSVSLVSCEDLLADQDTGDTRLGL